MSNLLKQAIDQANQLSESDQDALGQLLIDEMESERRWDDLFAKSPEVLKRLAQDAQDEHRAGRTLALDPDNL